MAKAIINGNEIFGNVHMGEGGDVANPNIADVYDPTQTYNTGDRCIYDDVLYVCNDDNVTGAWDSTKWDSATIDEIISALTAADIPYSAGVSVADKIDDIVGQIHIERGLATAQPNSYVRVTFSKPYTTAPIVSITPVNNTSPREYLRACTITTITSTYFEFAEVAIKASDKSFVNGSDSCSWVAYGV